MLFESESSVTPAYGVGFGSNFVESMASVCWCYPVKMSSIGGGQKIHVFGVNIKTCVTWMNGIGF